MPETISDVAEKARSDVEKFAAEAHADVERMMREITSSPTVPPAIQAKADVEAYARQAHDDVEAFKTAFRIGNSHIGKPIGNGAFGSVSWLNNDAPAGPGLVFKQPRPGEKMDGLRQEAAIHQKAGEHPNIAKCYGMQTIDGKEGLVMEGIKGGTMQAVMDRLEALRRGDKQALKEAGRDRALSQSEYVGTLQYMISQVLQGLVFLQKQGVVHNDIRPDNIMIDETTGAVKIVDFGLSFDAGPRPQGQVSPVKTGSVAPEHAMKNATIDGKADVFSAGEVVRKGMERDQFRYNAETDVTKAKDLRAFARPDANGMPQQALYPNPARMAPLQQQQTMEKRVMDVCGRLSGLIAEPFIAGTDPAKGLQELLRKASELSQKTKTQEDAEKEMNSIEQQVTMAELQLKRSGTYGAETAYTQFVNQLMQPDPSRRWDAAMALQHPFLTGRLLDDATAQEVLIGVLAPRQRADRADQPDSSAEVVGSAKGSGSFVNSGSGDILPLAKSGLADKSGSLVDSAGSGDILPLPNDKTGGTQKKKANYMELKN